jgi:hypothetical protein
VPASDSASLYDELIFQWLGQGRVMFDRESFRAACEKERLLDGGESRPLVFGVKSFEHPIDRLEERCTAVLDLVPEFDARFIRSESDWSSTLYPALTRFLLDAARSAEHLRLILDAHLSLSFAAGSMLNIKSGRQIELEQRTLGSSQVCDGCGDSWLVAGGPSTGGTRLAIERVMAQGEQRAVASW